MKKGLAQLFFLLTYSFFVHPMDPVQEQVRNEKLKDRSATYSYYEIPWSFGSTDRVDEYMEELNRKLSDHNLVALAQTNENEHILIITLKALFFESDTQGLPVHTIVMPLHGQQHSNRATDFLMHQRIDQITERGKNLRIFLEKLSKREVKQNWKHVFMLEILPSAMSSVSHAIGKNIGSSIKDFIIGAYQLFRLRKLLQNNNAQLIEKSQKLEAHKMYLEAYQSELDEIESSLTDASDEQEIMKLKKQKAALQRKYLNAKLKQTEE